MLVIYEYLCCRVGCLYVQYCRVNIRLPTLEMRYKNLCVEAECEAVEGKPIPTLWKATRSILRGFVKAPGLKSQEAKINILKNVSGMIKSSRMGWMTITWTTRMWRNHFIAGASEKTRQIARARERIASIGIARVQGRTP